MRRRIALTLALGVLLLPAAVFGLLASETGSRWLLGMAAGFAGDQMSFERAEGTLLSPLAVFGLKLRLAGHRLDIDELRLRYRPTALLRGVAHIEDFSASRIRYQPGPNAPPPEADSGGFSGVRLPLKVRLDAAEVTAVDITMGDARRWLNRLALNGLVIDTAQLAFEQFEFNAEGLLADGRGRLGAEAPFPLQADIRWSYPRPAPQGARGHARLSGNLEAIEVDHRLEAPITGTLSGTLSPLANPLRADLKFQWSALRWPLTGAESYRSDAGRIHLSGSPENFAVMVDAGVAGEKLPFNRVRADARGGLQADRLRTELSWTLGLVNGGEAAGRGILEGGPALWRVDHKLSKPFELSTLGDVTIDGETLLLALEGEWQDFGWPLTGEAQFQSASGRYRLAGPMDDLRLRVDAALSARAAQIDALALSLDARGAARAPFGFSAELNYEGTLNTGVPARGQVAGRGNINRIEFNAEGVLPFPLTAKGKVELDGDTPVIALDGDWRTLRWPLSGDAEYTSDSGRFQLSGPVGTLDLQLDAQLAGERLPPSSATLRGEIYPQSAKLHSLKLDTVNGRVNVTGELGWSPKPRWRLEVDAVHLNPEYFHPDWPGDVSLAAKVSGTLEQDSPKVSIALTTLGGQLRGYPISGRGSLAIDGTRVTAEQLELSSGENTVRLNGEAAETLDIGFVIEAPKLNAFAPQLEGSLNGSGALAGSRSQPRISAKLSGQQLAFRDDRVGSLSLDADVGIAPGFVSRLALEFVDISASGAALSKVTLSGNGTQENHRMVLRAESDEAVLDAVADASLKDSTWSAGIRADLATQNFGDWRLEQAAQLRAARDRVSLGRSCMTQASASLCVEGEWQRVDDLIRADGVITALPLGLAKPFLPEGVIATGPLNGSLAVEGRAAAPLAKARIEVPEGSLAYQPGADFPRTEFVFRDALLDARHQPTGTQLKLAVVVADSGRLQGNLDIGALSEDAPAALAGRLDAQLSDLAWIGVVLPQLIDVRGELDAGLDVAGNLNAPLLGGQIAVRRGQMDLPDLGLELREIGLAMRSESADRYLIEGGLTSGGGRLKISGAVRIPALEEGQLELTVAGEEFEVARLPTVQAFVSPDLRLSANANQAELTGRVHVPRATVKLKKLPPSAVAVSEDEVIVGRDKLPAKASVRRGPKLRLAIDLSLGDAVSFEGFGLFAGIEGGVAVSGETGQSLNAQGVISVRDGRYDAFGQLLTIEQGRLIFAGPIDNPGIDVTAVREIGDITAGIAVTGNAKSIKSSVFSTPPLPEAEAFSYLLTGRPLSGGTQGDAALLSSAALSMGLERSQLVTKQIGATLGLDELSVGGDSVAQSALIMGKQLTPDLFVRYALGLFEKSGRLLLDYRLTDSLTLQAESGETQGMDLIYRLERESLF